MLKWKFQVNLAIFLHFSTLTYSHFKSLLLNFILNFSSKEQFQLIFGMKCEQIITWGKKTI